MGHTVNHGIDCGRDTFVDNLRMRMVASFVGKLQIRNKFIIFGGNSCKIVNLIADFLTKSPIFIKKKL